MNSSQISLIETSIAVEQPADSELVLNTLLPSVSERSQAADTLGHNFAAAGMASILSALLQLKIMGN